MRNVCRLCLRAHTLKVEAAAWLQGGSRVRYQCPGEDEHVQDEMHDLYIAKTIGFVSWGENHFSFLFTFFVTSQQPNPFNIDSGAGFRPSLQPTWSPGDQWAIDFSFPFAVEELYGTQCQSGSFSFLMWGVLFPACVIFFPFAATGQQQTCLSLPFSAEH